MRRYHDGMMVRTQIQFEEAQIEALRALSSTQDKSVSELVRESVELFLRTTADEARVRRALKVTGKFGSGRNDISRNHDDYLAEAFADRGD
jgi:Arc/MetJ-type ribon-helix-helix transcriptional regulator